MKKLKLFFALFAMLALGVGNAWAEESLQVTLDFTTNSWGFPNGSSNKTTTEKTYTSGDYSIILAGGGSSNGHYFNSNGYLMLGKSGATLTLPAFDFNTTKIVVTGKSGASSSVKQNIYVGSNAVSTETTGAAGTNTYTINAANQVAGNVYILKVTSAHNTQITKIEVYGESVGGGDQTPYSIKWHNAVGTYTEETLTAGTTITKPATDPTMTGYEFMGWTEDCEVASDGAGFNAITDFGTADSDKDYYAVFAKAGTLEGEETEETENTVSLSIQTYASNNNWVNGVQYKSINIDNNITASVSGNSLSNTGKYYTSGYEWRIYQTENPKLTIEAKNNCTIKTVKITYSVSNSGTLKLNNTNIASKTVCDVNATSIAFAVGNTGTKTNGQVKVTAMDVVYTSSSASGGSSSTTYSDYITTCSGETVVSLIPKNRLF